MQEDIKAIASNHVWYWLKRQTHTQEVWSYSLWW